MAAGMLRVIGVVSTIAMRQVDSTRAVFVHYVWEPEERIPRCDTYDIHVIGGLVDRQLLSSARHSCG